jgi:hypothetical protein
VGDVVDFGGITRLPVDPERVLRGALEHGLERVMVVGVDAEGEEYFAASHPDGGTILWDMERAKHKLMQIADDDDGD